MFLQIAVNIPRVSGVFDYHLPDHLQGKVQPGSLVEVPFGRQTVQGIVLQEVPFPQVPETRPVLSLLDPEPVMTTYQIELAKNMSRDTLSSLSVCLGMMIPAGLRQQADTLYLPMKKALDSSGEEREKLTPLQRKLTEHLCKPAHRGSGLRGRQLDTVFRRQDWRRSARFLERKGWLTSYAVLPPTNVRPKTIRTVQLACQPEEALRHFDDLGRGKARERRQTILEFLMKEPWPVEVSWVYAASGGNLNDIKNLAERGLISLGESEVWRDPLEQVSWTPPRIPQLTKAQFQAWQPIQHAIHHQETAAPFVLHGVTGSGKTEIYLRAVEETLNQNRQAIVMVPEISLTPQTVRRFISRFPGQVGLIHSGLSGGERYDTWRRARSGLLNVIIGPRSALFTPLPNPGLIIVDECHDDSYYQGDPQPYYHTVETAIDYGKVAGCTVILGSATPPVTLLYQARERGWPILKLPQRILAHRHQVQAQMERLGRKLELQADEGDSAVLPLPPVKIIDMRQELKAGNRSIFSRELHAAIDSTLKSNQQAILFLNRRGRATYVFCRDCGFSLKCPNCDFPLTYHTYREEKDALVCHTCNYRRRMPAKCPQCSSKRIRHFGTGTETVESELQTVFPSARILRWDASTTRGKNAHEALLSHFVNHRADVLIGTQMLAKGLDLPLVTLVGVILAEVGLNFPDFRASERTFQLLTQVAGRAGRSPLGGKVILQTFQPGHYAIQAASRHDYSGFYNTELGYRKKIVYPPFSTLLRLEYRHTQAERAETTAYHMGGQIRNWLKQGDYRATNMIGPVPCYFAKLRGYYRWQIILRGPNPAQVVKDRPLGDWRVEINPTSLL